MDLATTTSAFFTAIGLSWIMAIAVNRGIGGSTVSLSDFASDLYEQAKSWAYRVWNSNNDEEDDKKDNVIDNNLATLSLKRIVSATLATSWLAMLAVSYLQRPSREGDRCSVCLNPMSVLVGTLLPLMLAGWLDRRHGLHRHEMEEGEDATSDDASESSDDDDDDDEDNDEEEEETKLKSSLKKSPTTVAAGKQMKRVRLCENLM